MSITIEEWEALVHRLERRAREDPAGYRRRVALFAAFGYAVIALALLVLAALVAGVVYLGVQHPLLLVKLALPIGGLTWVVARSVWVRLEPPAGIRLGRADAPELHRAIDEVNGRVRGPKIHEVLVTDDFNAAVVQIPRPGFVLGSRNYLILGLPYMQSKTPGELRSTIAHELGHLSGNHGRLGAWLYRVQESWRRLVAALEERRAFGTGLFRRFFEWYLPRFDARALPLMRAHELEADRLAVEAAGREAAAASLAGSAIGAGYATAAYWPAVFERARSEPEPPAGAFAELRQSIGGAYADERARAWFDEELARAADAGDTHPPLAERLEAIGIAPDDAFRLAVAARGPTSAEAYLGPLEARLTETLDAGWREAVRPQWREAHREAREAEEQLRRLEESDGRLPADDLRVRARLTSNLRGRDEALGRWREVLERVPGDAEASFAVGDLLLAAGDEAGLAHLERAAEADPDAVLPACELALTWLDQHGREGEAARWRERGERHLAILPEAHEERSSVEAGDEFAPAELPQDVVERIARAVAADGETGTAYLARKRVEHFDDEAPVYVLAVVPKHRWRTLWREADDREHPPLAERIQAALDVPVDVQVVVPGPRHGLDARLAEIDGARIFER